MTAYALLVDGTRYSGWKSLSVTRSLRDASAAFSLRVSEKWLGQPEPWAIRPGDACTLELEGEPVITGHVDVYAASIDETRHRVMVEGRSLTADLVDCAAQVPGGQFQAYDIAAIARALADPFGLQVRIKGSVGAAFPDVQIQQGETAFALIERLARMRGCVVTDAADGALVIAQAGSLDARPAVPVRLGGNALAAAVTLDWSGRFSKYTIKGQQGGSDDVFGEQAAAVSAVALDPEVKRFRPWMEIAEAAPSVAEAQKRANWQASTARGESTSVEVTVQGWTVDGALWSPGRRVIADLPALQVSRELIVAAVNFQAGEAGTVTRLTLLPEEALQPEPLTERPADNEGSII